MRQRCENLRAIMMFKIIINIDEVFTDGLLHPQVIDIRGHSQKFR